MGSALQWVLPHLHPGRASVTWFRVCRPRLNAQVKTRFPFGSPPEAVNLAGDGKSPDHYAKGTPSGIGRANPTHSPLTACRRVVSGSVSSPRRGSSHRSLALLFAIGRQGVLSLAGWAPPLRAHFHVLSPTQDTTKPPPQSCTGLSPCLAGGSTPFHLGFGSVRWSYNPGRVTPSGLGWSAFARRY